MPSKERTIFSVLYFEYNSIIVNATTILDACPENMLSIHALLICLRLIPKELRIVLLQWSIRHWLSLLLGGGVCVKVKVNKRKRYITANEKKNKDTLFKSKYPHLKKVYNIKK